MMPEQQQRILGYFIEEAKDHLNTIEQGLLNLQATIGDSETVNEVFRAAHSIKGGAAMLGIDSVQRTAHRMEDYFKILKEAPVQTDRTLESMFLQVFDGLQSLVEELQGPFGLTDEKAQEVMGDIEPVFGQLETHLNQLAGDAPAPAPAPATPAPAAAARAPHKEESALKLVFRSDVPGHLRDILGLFKQADNHESRAALQAKCDLLEGIGEQFELSAWCELVQATRRVVGNTSQTYRTLAPIVIKDLKQGQEQVLSGQGSAIAPSEAMVALLPPVEAAAPSEADLDALLDDALATPEEDADLADLFGTEAEAEAGAAATDDDMSWLDTPATEEASTEDDMSWLESGAAATDDAAADGDMDWFEGATSDTANGDSGLDDALASAFDSGDLSSDLGSDVSAETAAAEPPAKSPHGPEVGAAELNSLADLFEGEMSELDAPWQEESAMDLGGTDDDALDIDISSDFSDLLLSEEEDLNGNEGMDSQQELASLFGDGGLDEDSTAPEPPDNAADAAPAGDDDFSDLFAIADEPAAAADTDTSDDLDALLSPTEAPQPAASDESSESGDDFFESFASPDSTPEEAAIADDLGDLFGDSPAEAASPDGPSELDLGLDLDGDHSAEDATTAATSDAAGADFLGLDGSDDLSGDDRSDPSVSPAAEFNLNELGEDSPDADSLDLDLDLDNAPESSGADEAPLDLDLDLGFDSPAADESPSTSDELDLDLDLDDGADLDLGDGDDLFAASGEDSDPFTLDLESPAPPVAAEDSAAEAGGSDAALGADLDGADLDFDLGLTAEVEADDQDAGALDLDFDALLDDTPADSATSEDESEDEMDLAFAEAIGDSTELGEDSATDSALDLEETDLADPQDDLGLDDLDLADLSSASEAPESEASALDLDWADEGAAADLENEAAAGDLATDDGVDWDALIDDSPAEDEDDFAAAFETAEAPTPQAETAAAPADEWLDDLWDDNATEASPAAIATPSSPPAAAIATDLDDPWATAEEDGAADALEALDDLWEPEGAESAAEPTATAAEPAAELADDDNPFADFEDLGFDEEEETGAEATADSDGDFEDLFDAAEAESDGDTAADALAEDLDLDAMGLEGEATDDDGALGDFFDTSSAPTSATDAEDFDDMFAASGDLDAAESSTAITDAAVTDAAVDEADLFADAPDLDLSAGTEADNPSTEDGSDDLDDLDDLLGESSAPAEADSSDFDDLLADEPQAAASPSLSTELENLSGVAAPAESEGEDFDDLDALLDDGAIAEDLDGTDGSDTDRAADSDTGDFDDLEAMLASDEDEGGDDFDDLEAMLAPEGDADGDRSQSNDFDDLDALLDSDDEADDSDAVDDEFGDLEKLLEAADKSLGGTSPTIRSGGTSRASRRVGAMVDQTMRVSVKHLDTLSNLVGELVVNRNSLEQDQERLRQFLDNLLFQVQQLNDVGQRMRDLYERSLLESSLISSRQAFHAGVTTGGGNGSHGRASDGDDGQHATGATFDALEMDRFTGFHTLSQEMIELIVRVRESASDIGYTVESSDQITRQFRQVTTQLQEGLNKARMVPFAQTADRLPRAVRDISLKCGKEARLVVEGRDTLIDKMILERLYDPMTHLVNNAITHGIETPEERVAAGKPREGTITVRAFYQGNQTVIYIADDGGGINADMVKQKAIKKGLITQAEARSMSEMETHELLFRPGFSTRDKADDFAGRGVGMDVVRTALSEIRGAITIDSELGKGTGFTIRLPLTLSISKALSCLNNQARIAFPMDGVEDMFDVPKERVQDDTEGHQVITWRDTQLAFQPLSELLQFNRTLGRGRVYGGSQDDDMVSIVVLRNANTYIGLQVDRVLGEQEIVIKQLEGPVPKPVGIAGATVLGDGRVMPIADVLELIDLAQGRVRRESGASLWTQEAEPPEPEEDALQAEPTVLIVDDSITVRELLSMSFNKVGYRVEQARDGQEAWEKLRSGLPCDLVFCDIEMPRMDGLELLSRMQKDSALKAVPIAMLTSRGADRHRQMALDLGASGYFTKPYLEEALLDAAQRMLKGEVLLHAGKAEE